MLGGTGNVKARDAGDVSSLAGESGSRWGVEKIRRVIESGLTVVVRSGFGVSRIGSFEAAKRIGRR